jgi:hypothetical protein
MSQEPFPPTTRPAMAVVEIDAAFTRPAAIVSAMLSVGHEAITQVARGAIWEGEDDIRLVPELAAHAGRMALLWARTAQHLQCQEQMSRRLRPHTQADLARSARSGFRTDPPAS